MIRIDVFGMFEGLVFTNENWKFGRKFTFLASNFCQFGGCLRDLLASKTRQNCILIFGDQFGNCSVATKNLQLFINIEADLEVVSPAYRGQFGGFLGSQKTSNFH